MFVAWLKPPWQQITPYMYIVDRRFCAREMKRNGAKEKKVEATAREEDEDEEDRGAEKWRKGIELWGPMRRWITLRPFSLWGPSTVTRSSPLYGWRRDFSRSASGNSRNTANRVGAARPTCISGPSSGRLPYFCRANLTPPPSSFSHSRIDYFRLFLHGDSRFISGSRWNPRDSPYKLYPPTGMKLIANR